MIKKKGLLLVISGPSGAGKGTVCKELLKRNPDFKLSVSATTRAPREGEVDGESYYFLTKEKFNEMIGHVMKYLEEGKDVILEIEMQGARQVKEMYPEAVLIFVLPPSLEELRNRLTTRGTETQEQVNERLSTSFEEIKQVKDYNYFIFNENNKTTESAMIIENLIVAEKNKASRYEKAIIKKFEEEL